MAMSVRHFCPLPNVNFFCILSAACERMRVPVVAGEVGVLLPEERVVAGPEAGALVVELETNVLTKVVKSSRTFI